MFLTKEEEKMLNGEMGEAKRKAMEIIVKLGDFFGAENTIDVENVHISGISYKNLGDPGLDFLKKFKNEKVKLNTTLNPIGFDLDFPDFFTNDSNFIKKQIEIINIFHSMGANNTLTCTPYYIENIWEKEHLAWAESSAIVYANSIIGARTNRESGISALASSITGKSANYGLHLDEGRKSTHTIFVDFSPSFFDYSLIGFLIGKTIKNGIPYIIGLKNDLDALKSLGASMNSTGSIPMFHAENITPEWKYAGKGDEKIRIDKKDIDDIRMKISVDIEPDAVLIGCPHLSEGEISAIAAYLKKRFVKKNKNLLLFTSKFVKEKMQDEIKIIEKSGAKVFSDTCMVVSPISHSFNTIGLSSGKATYYLGKEKLKIFYSDIQTLLEMITYEY